MAALRSKRTGLILRLGLGAAILGYGIYIADPGAPRLMIFGLTLFALPLVFQFSPWPLARAYALWFGVFLVVQGLITPLVVSTSLIRRPPNLNRIVTYADGVRPGVTGPQRFTTDERGYRVTPRVNYARKAGLRIFAIGGSTTEQSDIDDEATWAHLAQAALIKEFGKPVEIINAGVAGLRAEHHATTLEQILPLDPDIVTFLVGVNDWHFDIYSQFGSDWSNPLPKFPDTLLGQTARMQSSRLFGTPRVELTVTRMPPRRSLEREEKISWFPETVSVQYLANLRSIGDICRANNLTCIFLTQPNAYQPGASQDVKDLFVMTPADASYTLTFESLVHIADLYNRALIDFAKREDHVLCDLASAIAATTENYTDEIHFTLAGSRVVAEHVTECLRPLVARLSGPVREQGLDPN